MFNAVRFMVARQRRGLNKGGLAEKIDVDLRTITAYERGEFEPSPDTMSKIVRVLSLPLGWFFGEDIHYPSTQTASFRSQARMSAKKRDAALAAGAFAFLVNDWIEKRFSLPDSDLPDLREETPEAAATILRQQWGLGERPIKNMVHLLESKGIRVFSLAEDTTEVDAFSLWKETTPFVFLNTIKSAERSRFDAAHELGHLILHRHAGPSGKDVEQAANSFASAFLMPRGSMLGYAPLLPSLETLIQLKKQWLVSVSALAYRLHELGIVTDWNYRTICIELRKHGFHVTEPMPEQREMSMIFPQVFKALRDDGITKQDVADALSLSVEEIDKLVFGLILVALNGGVSSSQSSQKRPTLRVVK